MEGVDPKTPVHDNEIPCTMDMDKDEKGSACQHIGDFCEVNGCGDKVSLPMLGRILQQVLDRGEGL